MPKRISFEEGLAELEAIARNLETGTIPLDESFAAFERAMKIKKNLEKILNEGDRKIKVLLEDSETEIDPEDL